MRWDEIEWKGKGREGMGWDGNRNNMLGSIDDYQMQRKEKKVSLSILLEWLLHRQWNEDHRAQFEWKFHLDSLVADRWHPWITLLWLLFIQVRQKIQICTTRLSGCWSERNGLGGTLGQGAEEETTWNRDGSTALLGSHAHAHAHAHAHTHAYLYEWWEIEWDG